MYHSCCEPSGGIEDRWFTQPPFPYATSEQRNLSQISYLSFQAVNQIVSFCELLQAGEFQ